MEHYALHIRRESTLTMKIYEALSESLISGLLAPGKPIIIEQVAQQLNVSPTPVRESMTRLAEQGVLVRGSNGRLSVAQLTPAYIRDIYLVRSVLEGLAAELAAPRVSPEILDAINVDLEDILTSVENEDYQQYVAAVDDIFIRIEQAANSTTLSRELSVLRLHCAYVRSLTKKRVKDYITPIHDELNVVAAFLENRDSKQARCAMETYFRNSGGRVAEILGLQIGDDETP